MEHAPQGSSDARKRVLLLVLLFSAFSVLLKLPSLRFVHNEPDEVVYWTVATNLIEHGAYSLEGSTIGARLSPAIYDRPLFHHPPLYPVLLTPFVIIGAPGAAVVISWLGHLLCIVSVGLVAGTLIDREEGTDDDLRLALLGVATDPLLTHVSRKLWIDALLAGLVALALALVWAAQRSPRRRLLLIAGGVVLGLAGLTKLPGLLVAPVAALLVWGGNGTRRTRSRELLLVAVPCLLIVLPWLVLFVSTYGVVVPGWLKPDEVALRRFPFLAAAMDHRWPYYAVKVALAQPIAVLGLVLWLLGSRVAGPTRFAAPAWLFLWLAVATIQSANGYGYQMRYLAPLAPSIYLTLLCARSRGELTKVVVSIAVAYGAMGSTPYLLTESLDELVTLPELARLVRF